MSLVMALVSLIVFLIFCLIYFYVIKLFRSRLRTPELLDKLGFLTRELRVRSYIQMYFPIIFILKRLLMAIFLVFFNGIVQMYATISIQFCYIAYLVIARPLY